MVRISISELNPAGADLFSDSQNFMDSIRDLSLEELKATKGGGSKSKCKKSGSKNKKSGSKNKSCYFHC